MIKKNVSKSKLEASDREIVIPEPNKSQVFSKDYEDYQYKKINKNSAQK